MTQSYSENLFVSIELIVIHHNHYPGTLYMAGL